MTSENGLTRREDEDELGPDLTDQQTQIVLLLVQEGLSHAAIAERVGYAQQQSVTRFLGSERGRAGVAWAVQRTLAHAAGKAMATLLNILQHSKSDKVRAEVAIDLLNRAGMIQAQDQGRASRGSGGVTIVIGGDVPQAHIIEHGDGDDRS